MNSIITLVHKNYFYHPNQREALIISLQYATRYGTKAVPSLDFSSNSPDISVVKTGKETIIDQDDPAGYFFNRR